MGPAFASTRRRSVSLSVCETATSKTASTRVSERCACCPPGPLEREKRSVISESGIATDEVTRIDSASMSAILLDVDGVLHVSGTAIDGAANAVRQLRSDGHRLRFVTNNTTRSRQELAEELRKIGVSLDDEELQTIARSAAQTLAGKRVLVLAMPAIVEDLEGIELVGDHADVVLLGGADETPETNQVFSYMNLARAFEELESGAALYCLHKNRWWQTSRGPLLDAGAFVAGLEYATGSEATVLGKPSAEYFEAALESLDADAGLSWMVGDDLESDIAGAQSCGMRTILVRTGKFREADLDAARARPDAVLDSICALPDWLDQHARGS